ncbi:unnamed protein product [Adineta steineri]|uniref:C2 domain-containing protein n=1 Tax=Adineta steineri TaxID=433720 RepID=A0A813WYL1_9BILA|nr:unnamed protein product [Adineta steineri]CAF0867894.1 unnamed protein product [Adineta steineri]
MLNSLKRWVQDVAVDLTPPPPPPSSSSTSTSPSFLSSSSKQGSTHPYFHSTTFTNDRLSTHSSSSSTMGLSRPISMDSVRNSKMINTSIPPPPLASPAELDLSHLNREEQEHIANVLKRARAVDEQQSPVPPVIVHSAQSPPASIVSASLSPSASSSSSTSTSSYNSEQPEKYEQNDKYDNIDDNEISKDEELSSSFLPESTLIAIHRCQVCNKEQQQKGNTMICLHCQADDEIARVTQNNTTPQTSIRQSSSPIPIKLYEHEQDKIYDNIMWIDQQLIKRNSPVEENTSHRVQNDAEKMNKNQEEKKEENDDDDDYDDDGGDGSKERKQLCQSSILQSTLPVKIQSNNLTEIDEDDFFYQGPSPYVTAIDNNNQILDKIKDPSSIPSYKIDEYIDEDDNDERDHVKELEETIANLSRHFPVSSQQLNDIEIKPIVTNLHQPSSLSVGKIDIDSILEMEIESPSTDEHYIQSSSSSSSSIRPSSVLNQHSHNVPIAVPITFNSRRASLSRSSGVRENLTDLLSITKAAAAAAAAAASTTTIPLESYYSDKRSLQGTTSNFSKHIMPLHRQKRNLPSVPSPITNRLQLRRANSESRFSLPAVPPPSILISNSNIDDESDLLEIDLNDPTGSTSRAARSKTESELNNNNNNITTNNNNNNNNINTLSSSNQLSSMNDLTLPKKQIKQLRDQTTNTPPISSLTSSIKPKKKLKKKGSNSPNHTNGHLINSMESNEQITPIIVSPTKTNPPPSVLLSSSSPPTLTTNRLKLQKSTSTEILYPFPVLKLILSRDNLNPSRRDDADLGLHITGGHSIPNCMEVTACIEHVDTHHKNYNILRNAVEEGDEVLEVGGVPLRGKSALYVENLMNSIQDEFEIVIRSQYIIPPISPAIEIFKSDKNHSHNSTKNNVTVSPNLSLTVDSNNQRRHSMDTSQFSPTHLTNNTVVKSQSTFMSLPVDDDSNNVSDQLLSPSNHRKKSVSSKERLFSVESLHRSPSTKSIEHLMKVATQSYDTKPAVDRFHSLPQGDRRHSIKPDEKRSTPLVKQTSLSVNITPENKMTHDDSINLAQPLQPPRKYEHRNSLLPNDPGLNRAGSNNSIDRRNSNESDESDNLSQYFLSSSSRKNSLMTTNEISHTESSHEQNQNIIPTDNEVAKDASRRLQNFIKTADEKQQSRNSLGDESINFKKTDVRKLSTSALGSFKFAKKPKENNNTEISTQSVESRENEYVGDIELQIGHNSEREQLVVRIVQAKNLPAKDTNGFSDPFVKIYLLPGRDQENKRRTKHISKNLNPVWDHTVIYGNMHREELQYKMLEFTLWDYDRFKANDFIGQITIDLKDAKVIDDKPHWYRLQALRSREEATNRGSSPRLSKMTSVDSTVSSSSSIANKNNVNVQSKGSIRK